MTNNHNNCSEKHHRSTFSFVINKRAEERSEYHCQYREPLEQSCSFGIADLQRLFEEVGCKALEGEDSGIIEHAEKCNNPEHLRAEDLSEVGNMEFVLRVFFRGRFSDSHQLLVETVVHDCEDKEIEQAYYEQQRSKEQGSRYRVHAI